MDSLLVSANATVGVQVLDQRGRSIYAHLADSHLVMMSVVKMPQAIAMLDQVDRGRLSLDSVIGFDSLSLKRETWSPFADEHQQGDAEMNLKTCLSYSAGMSDNIVCDRLYGLLSYQKVEAYVHGLGIEDFGIGTDYLHMNADNLGLNYASARALATVLQRLRKGDLLRKSSTDLLLDILRTTTTGPKRLKAELPEGTVIAHKTGTYFDNDTLIQAINDVGIVELPEGGHYVIAVLVNKSLIGPDATEALIARLNKLTWEYMTAKNR